MVFYDIYVSDSIPDCYVFRSSYHAFSLPTLQNVNDGAQYCGVAEVCRSLAYEV